MGKSSDVATTPEVVQAVDNLRAALKTYYGADFSFLVLGRGHIVASDTLQYGKIDPVVQSSLMKNWNDAWDGSSVNVKAVGANFVTTDQQSLDTLKRVCNCEQFPQARHDAVLSELGAEGFCLTVEDDNVRPDPESLVDWLENLLSITERFKCQMEGDDLKGWQTISADTADARMILDGGNPETDV